MLKNYLKVAFRNIAKHRLYTIINIFGLAVSLGLCLVAVGHVCYELTFEDVHENKDRIYRVNLTYTSADTSSYTSLVMSPLGYVLRDEIPEVEYAAVFRVLGNIDIKVGAESYVSDKDQTTRQGYLHEGNVFCANPDFLKVFALPLVQGNPETVLSEPYSILITEKAAHEFFPDQNPMGQIVKLNDKLTCTVTGVLKNIPENTQVFCDFIVSYASLQSTGEDTESWNQYGNDYAYLLLRKDANKADVESKIPGVVKKYLSEERAPKFAFELQPLKDIYFSTYGSGRWGDLGPHGELSMIIEMSVTLGFVLLLAIANFINLSTARSAERMKEVGMRKVMGAKRWNLIKQFLGESILITFISVLVGLVFYEFFKIYAGGLFGREALVDFYNSPLMILSLFCLILVVGILAGFYPALYLSRFRPISILQSRTGIKSSKSNLRRVLVVFQFTIAVLLICGTVILYNQVSYMSALNMGFEKENVLLLKFWGDDTVDNCQLVKNELENNGHVVAMTAVNAAPGYPSNTSYGFYPTEDRRREDMVTARAYFTDYDFLSTFGLEIIQGRAFSENIEGETNHSMIINESMAEYLQLDNPIGYRFYRKEGFYEVVGVVKDFYGALQDYSKSNRAVIILDPGKLRTLAVKLPSEDISGSVTAIGQVWKAALPGVYFDYTFLEDEVDKGFDGLRGETTMFLVLSLLAISMGCLGIFGLVAYTAEQKTKEIGIRKVMGASVASIIKMLSREFIVLILISNIIAWPLAYKLTDDILQYFVERANVGIGTFVLTGFFAMILALIAAGYQAVKAARTDPVETLRYE